MREKQAALALLYVFGQVTRLSRRKVAKAEAPARRADDEPLCYGLGPRDVALIKADAERRAALTAAARTARPAELPGRFEGERPTGEHLKRVGRDGAAIVDVGALDKSMRGVKAVRLASGWQGEAMAARGLITARQAAAAKRLTADWDAAGFDKIGGQAWKARVDGAAAPGVAHAIAAKRRRIMDLLRAMPPLVRQVVEQCVIAGRSIEIAAACVKASWLPAGHKTRPAAMRVLLGLGLEQAADAYGL